MEGRELPVGWELISLSEAGFWGSGGTPSRKSLEYYGGNIPWIKTGELGPRVIDQAEEHITESGIANSSAKIFRPGSVVIAMYGATIGKVSILGIPAATNQACAVAEVDQEITTSDFLFHYLCSQRDQFAQAGKGGAQPNISQGLLKSWPFPLPPLNEQRRIAAKLDTTLAAVEACRQRLDGVAELLKRFRQAVLAAATSGELTREWREERGRGLDSWAEQKVGNVVSAVEAGLNVQCDERPPDRDEKGLVKISAVTWGEYDEEESKTLRPDAPILEKNRIRPGDFLISRANTIELVGACVIVKDVKRSLFLSDKVLRLIVPDDWKHWLLLSLRSPAGRRQIEGLSSGNQLSMRNLSQKNLLSIRLLIPPVDELEDILARAQHLFTLAGQLEARLNSARKVVDRLTPALLAKAFRGELVPQDPADEPASVLLARIRAARQAEAGAARPSRRGRPKAAANPEPIDRNAAPAPSEPLPPDLLTQLLRECGALSERALLAASELEPEGFFTQLERELQLGSIRQSREEGQVLLEAVA